jgi:hypothetical protein
LSEKTLGQIAFETTVGRWSHTSGAGWESLAPHARGAWEECANTVFRAICERGYVRMPTADDAVVKATGGSHCKVCGDESNHAALHSGGRCYKCADAGK